MKLTILMTFVSILSTFQASALTGKLTVRYKNHEEKTFRYADTGKPQALDIGLKRSFCNLSFGKIDNHNYVSLGCSPAGEKLKYFRYYSTRSLCDYNGFSVLAVSDGEWSKNDMENDVNIMIECEN